MAQRHYGGLLTAPSTAASLRSLLISAGFLTAAANPAPNPFYRTLVIRLRTGSGPVYFGRNNGANADGTATTNLTNAGVGATGSIDTTLPSFAVDCHGGAASADNFFIAGNASDTIQVDLHE